MCIVSDVKKPQLQFCVTPGRKKKKEGKLIQDGCCIHKNNKEKILDKRNGT